MMITVAERWVPVVSCEGRYEAAYQVSDRGHVQSVTRQRPGRQRRDGTISSRQVEGQVLSPRVRQNGLRCVNLWDGNDYDQVPVRVLVLEGFRGPCPDGHVPVNLNGDMANNQLYNLAWKPAASAAMGLSALRRRMSRR